MRQVGALAYRRVRDDEPDSPIEVMLVTSRQTRRWIIPKGNIEPGMTLHDAAAREAEEEAGVRGEIGRDALGSFTYEKRIVSGLCVTAEVIVFPFAVRQVFDEWKEASSRRRKWFSLEEASLAVEEPGLRAIFDVFRP